MKTNNKISLLSILNEQSNSITLSQMSDYVETIGDALDGWVTLNNLKEILRILKIFKGKTYKNQDAYGAFLKFYKNRENWGDFPSDVEGVGTKNLGPEGVEVKEEIINFIDTINNGTPPTNTKSTTAGGVKVNFPNKNKASGSATAKPKSNGGYKPCTSFPFAIGCQSKQIAEIQSCISIPSDGKFGNQTLKALTDLTYDMSGKKITQEIYDKVKANCGANSTKSTTSKYNTPKAFYDKLLADGLIIFDEDTQGEEVLVYGGPKLSKVDTNKLDLALKSKGFSKLSPLDRNYGSDLVYKILGN